MPKTARNPSDNPLPTPPHAVGCDNYIVAPFPSTHIRHDDLTPHKSADTCLLL